MSLQSGQKWKGGNIGSEYDRHAARRHLGCDCCPHGECVCDNGCEERCPYHAPRIIAELRGELNSVQMAIRKLMRFAFPDGEM